MVGIWTPQSAGTELAQRLASARADTVVTTLKGAVQQLSSAAADESAVAPSNGQPLRPEMAAKEPEFAPHDPDELFDATKREVATAFDVPLSFVSIVQFDSEFWKSHDAELQDEEINGLLRDSSICSQISDATEPVAVEDVSKDKRLTEDPFLQSRGIQSYLAAPLRTEAGHGVGSLCVLDTKPRTFASSEMHQLQTLAENMMKAVEAHSAPAAA